MNCHTQQGFPESPCLTLAAVAPGGQTHGNLTIHLRGDTMAELQPLFAEVEEVLERMISQQRDKVRDVALDILPHLSPDELQDPQDHPEVTDDAMFNFEDGLLAGLMSARMALRSTVFDGLTPPTP